VSSSAASDGDDDADVDDAADEQPGRDCTVTTRSSDE
jgi:hypothetical protein